MKKNTRDRLVLPLLIPFGSLVLIGAALWGFSRVLLAISHNAATGVALVVTVAIMTAAGLVARQKRVQGGALVSLMGVVAGIAMMAGGLAYLVVGPQKHEVEPTEVHLAAAEGAATAGFSRNSLSFPADTPVVLAFDNEDPGVQHNVQIFSADPAEDASQEPLFSGALVTGPAAASYAVEPLAGGTYFFNCLVHPATMTGTIEVAAGGGAGGAGSTIVAKDLVFDATEIDLPAGTPSTLNFDNQDAGVPHNVAIYTDAEATTTLFQGEQFAGPAAKTYDIPALDAGTYFFRCDVHPTMNGSVLVGGGGSSPEPSPTEEATSSEPPSAEPPPPGDISTTITASVLVFDTDQLTFEAGTASTLSFDNKDAGVPHNVAIYSDAELTTTLFLGEQFAGPDVKDYEIPPLEAGTYFFRCDVHPTMKGTVTVV